MQTTLLVNNKNITVETNDGVTISAIEFCGKMISIVDPGAFVFAKVLQMHWDQKRQLKIAWASYQTQRLLDEQDDRALEYAS